MTTANTKHTPTGATPQAVDLLLRAGGGDSAAWEEVVRRYAELVSATVRSFRLQDADALDAVQMTWLRLAENVHSVLWPERLGGWLVTTARHECLRIVRQAKPSQNLIETVADPSVGPEQQAIEADTARTLWSLVEELSPRQQILLRALFADHPRPYAEVARSTGIPSGAIGPTRARALRQLRDRLAEHGLARRPGDGDRRRVHTVRGPAARDTTAADRKRPPGAVSRTAGRGAGNHRQRCGWDEALVNGRAEGDRARDGWATKLAQPDPRMDTNQGVSSNFAATSLVISKGQA